MLKVSNSIAAEAAQMVGLVGELADTDGVARQRARRRLVSMGSTAVAPLASVIHSEQRHVSWEVAKALGEIGDEAAIPALVQSLNSPDGDVSWVAADSLVQFRRAALIPVLKGLLDHAGFAHFRIGAHHVLSRLHQVVSDEQLDAVLDALDHPYPELSVPVAVDKFLRELRSEKR